MKRDIKKVLNSATPEGFLTCSILVMRGHLKHPSNLNSYEQACKRLLVLNELHWAKIRDYHYPNQDGVMGMVDKMLLAYNLAKTGMLMQWLNDLLIEHNAFQKLVYDAEWKVKDIYQPMQKLLADSISIALKSYLESEYQCNLSASRMLDDLLPKWQKYAEAHAQHANEQVRLEADVLLEDIATVRESVAFWLDLATTSEYKWEHGEGEAVGLFNTIAAARKKARAFKGDGDLSGPLMAKGLKAEPLDEVPANYSNFGNVKPINPENDGC